MGRFLQVEPFLGTSGPSTDTDITRIRGVYSGQTIVWIEFSVAESSGRAESEWPILQMHARDPPYSSALRATDVKRQGSGDSGAEADREHPSETTAAVLWSRREVLAWGRAAATNFHSRHDDIGDAEVCQEGGPSTE